jgi:hypothetical protein
MRSPAAALEISAVVLDRLNVIIERLNAISSGIVLLMKMQKYVSKGTIWRRLGRNLVEI